MKLRSLLILLFVAFLSHTLFSTCFRDRQPYRSAYTSDPTIGAEPPRAKPTAKPSPRPQGVMDLATLLQDAVVVAQDGEYLGKIAGPYASESILNEYGTYGSPYSSSSIWNEYGMYGGEYSMYSPFNEYSSSPPYIMKDGKVIGLLTVNKYLEGAVNPWLLKTLDLY